MGLAALLLLVLTLAPESLFACAQHVLPLDSSALKAPASILFNALSLFALAAPFGFGVGKLAQRSSRISRALIFAVVLGGIAAVTGYSAWACHGVKVTEPFLKQVYEAQERYHKAHGTYASSFDKLGIRPPSDSHSYFLPSQSFPAKDSRPKEGVDLTRLPKGVAPEATSKQFQVVAMGFTKPDRIDIWTLNQANDFKEWSVPAFSEVQIKPAEITSMEIMWTIQLINRLEVPLMVIALILGLTIGFVVTTRASTRFLPVGF